MTRVFVVEDEAVVALEIKDHLREMGYEVCGHASRAEAALQDIPDAKPDLVLMDINLGAGLSGLDVAERLAPRVDAPVIFLTVYSDEELTVRASRGSSFAYLVKPFAPRALAANIELALRRHAATAAFADSEARFRALFMKAGVGVAEIDSTTGRFLRVNRKYGEIAGYSPEAMVGLDAGAVTHPDDRAAGVDDAARLRRAEVREFAREKRYVRPDGTVVWVTSTVSSLTAAGEPAPRHMEVVQDVSASKAAQIRRSEMEEFLALASEVARVEPSEGDTAGATVDFGNYVRAMVDEAVRSVANREECRVDVMAQDVLLPVELARVGGMVVYELVTNSLLHGFPNAGPGTTTVSVRMAAGRVAIAVDDDGVGLPETFDPSMAHSFGWELIRTLVTQLEGALEVGRGQGAHVAISFPVPASVDDRHA